MRKPHVISGLVLMLFGILICFQAAKLPFGTSRSPGPAMLPFGAGALLFLLAAIFLLTSRPAGGRSTREPADALWRGLDWKRVPCTLAALFAYGFLVERLGYIVTTSLLMVYLFTGKGPRRWFVAIGAGLGVAIVSYVLFEVMLKVRLPSGLIRL